MGNLEKERDISQDLLKNNEDYIHAGVKAVLATIPFFGNPIAEFFSQVITPPLEQRRNTWIIEIFNRLKIIEERTEGFKIESLAHNEVFISTLFYATQAAMRTHQLEKLTALRNAVMNSAINLSIEENLQLIFLNLIDRYTPWHLIILKFLDDPKQYGIENKITYPNYSMGGTSAVLEDAMPELKGKRQFYDMIVNDLYSIGLINSDSFLHSTMTENGMFASRTTEMGKQFLEYISENN